MSKQLNSTPKSDDFRMPGEHEPQDAVWLVWPERTDTWQWGAKPAQEAFVDVAKAIVKETPVTMLVSARQYSNALRQLPSHIRVIEMTTNDSWLRDSGPSYVVNDMGSRRAVDWEFNAWGGQLAGAFFPWDADDAVAQKVANINQDDYYRAPLILEGGSIHVDGEGTLFTTEECLLHPSRNPDMSKSEIEHHLKDYLNIDKVIWLPLGLYADEDTNGHVDNLLHVVRPGEVVLSWTEDRNDPQYAISQEAYKILSETKDAKGRSLIINKLPIPGPLYITENEAQGFDVCEEVDRRAGTRMAGSYVNFLITNQRVIFPLLDEKMDGIAQQTLEEIFPSHQVVGVPGRNILLGGGNIHCITQQIPSVS